MKRKNLRNHLDEKRMEHLELKMDIMQECISEQNEKISEQNEKIFEQNEKISEQIEKFSEQNEKISEQNEKIFEQNEKISEQIEKFSEQNEKISEQNEKISEQKEKISEQKEKISEQNEKISEQNEKISEQNEKISEQNEKISVQGATIQTMSHEMKSLEGEVVILTKLFQAIKIVWRITKIPGSEFNSCIQKQFQVAGYNLEFCISSDLINLQIRVRPQTGKNYDKLKWPFKAEFVTHFSSQSNPGNIEKFKSGVFEVKREDFRPHHSNYFTIVIFPRAELMKQHSIYSEAEIEIFVTLL